jgi:surfeit locus 1 family protein
MPQKSFLAPTLFTIFGVVLLLGLGTWQVQRLHWKEGLIAERAAAMAAAPVDLPRTLAAAQALAFRPVRATGTFRHARELYLHATAENGAAGYHIVTPLALARGGTVLVDRGFVPEERKSPATRPAGNAEGPREVTGIVHLPPDGKSSWFVPDNRPERNEWFWLDLPAMAEAAGVSDALPFLVDADATPNPGGLPRGGQTIIDLPNNHLQYAITWYALAGCLVVVYILLARRRRGAGDQP